jgi:hypothetical protein
MPHPRNDTDFMGPRTEWSSRCRGVRQWVPLRHSTSTYKVNGVLIRQRRSTQPRGARLGTPLQLVQLSKPALPDIAGDLGNYFDVERFGDDPVGLEGVAPFVANRVGPTGDDRHGHCL